MGPTCYMLRFIFCFSVYCLKKLQTDMDFPYRCPDSEYTPYGRFLFVISNDWLIPFPCISQSTSMAYGKVTEDNVYTCTGHPLRSDIANILDWSLNKDFTSAYNRILYPLPQPYVFQRYLLPQVMFSLLFSTTKWLVPLPHNGLCIAKTALSNNNIANALVFLPLLGSGSECLGVVYFAGMLLGRYRKLISVM